jgi:hypothetical protein
VGHSSTKASAAKATAWWGVRVLSWKSIMSGVETEFQDVIPFLHPP